MKFPAASLSRYLRVVLIALVMCSATRAAEEWESELVRVIPKPGQEHSPVITALAIDPTGRFVALGGDDHVVRVWDLTEKQFVLVLNAHTDWVRTLTYSPTGEMLVTSGNDRRVIVWNTSSGEKLREYSELTHVVTSVVFSRDGKLVGVVGFGDKLRIIDGVTGDRLREYSCPTSDMRTVAFSTDDQFIVGGGRNGMIRLWNSADGTVIGEFSAHSQRIRDLAFSPDGTLIATCGDDRRVVISKVNGQQIAQLPRQGAKVMTLVFCGPDHLATGGSDNTIHIWDINTKTELAKLAGHTGTIAGLVYANDVLVSSGYDTTVRVWRRQASFVSQPTDADNSLNFVPDGQ